jgi:hypothetical protein
VTGVEAHHVPDTLLTALRMHPDPLEVPRRSSTQKPEIRVAQDRKLLEHSGSVRIVVTKSLGPRVLIVASQRRPIVGQNHAKAIAPDKLGVREMLHDMPHRPFARRLSLRDLARGESRERPP